MKYRISIVVILIVLLVTTIIVANRDYKIEVEQGTIYGTLNHETDDKIVIIVAGSGPTDRDGNSGALGGRNDSLKELAKSLNDNGVSTFAFDKRSSGKSVESFDLSDISFDDMIQDARSVLEEMKKMNYKEIYIIGHSQGALIAEILGQDDRVTGIISLCGTVNSIDKVLIGQLQALDVETAEAAEKIINQISHEDYDFEVPESLKQIFEGNAKFLHSWIVHDPMEYISKISNKLLFVYGDLDLQVNNNETELLDSNYEHVIISNMNHVLKTVHNDFENSDSYANPIYKISPKLVDVIVEFLYR